MRHSTQSAGHEARAQAHQPGAGWTKVYVDGAKTRQHGSVVAAATLAPVIGPPRLSPLARGLLVAAGLLALVVSVLALLG